MDRGDRLLNKVLGSVLSGHNQSNTTNVPTEHIDEKQVKSSIFKSLVKVNEQRRKLRRGL